MVQLICEDARSLGSGMGRERTYYIWDTLHESVKDAKKKAVKYVQENRPDEKVHWSGGNQSWSWDAGAWIFTIRAKKVEE